MTDRRSFFKSLALIGAAAAGCPRIFIPKLEPVRWKRSKYQRCAFRQYDIAPPYKELAAVDLASEGIWGCTVTRMRLQNGVWVIVSEENYPGSSIA